MPVICGSSNATCAEKYQTSSTLSTVRDQTRSTDANAAAQSEVILWRKLAIGCLVGCVVISLLAGIAWFYARQSSKRRALGDDKTSNAVSTTKSGELSKLMPYARSTPHLKNISEASIPCYAYAVQSDRDDLNSPMSCSTPGWLTSPLTLPELPGRDQIINEKMASASPTYPTPIMASPYSPCATSPQFSRSSCFTVFEEHMAPGPQRVVSQKDRTSMRSSSAVVLGSGRRASRGEVFVPARIVEDPNMVPETRDCCNRA